MSLRLLLLVHKPCFSFFLPGDAVTDVDFSSFRQRGVVFFSSRRDVFFFLFSLPVVTSPSVIPGGTELSALRQDCVSRNNPSPRFLQSGSKLRCLFLLFFLCVSRPCSVLMSGVPSCLFPKPVPSGFFVFSEGPTECVCCVADTFLPRGGRQTHRLVTV